MKMEISVLSHPLLPRGPLSPLFHSFVSDWRHPVSRLLCRLPSRWARRRYCVDGYLLHSDQLSPEPRYLSHTLIRIRAAQAPSERNCLGTRRDWQIAISLSLSLSSCVDPRRPCQLPTPTA